MQSKFRLVHCRGKHRSKSSLCFVVFFFVLKGIFTLFVCSGLSRGYHCAYHRSNLGAAGLLSILPITPQWPALCEDRKSKTHHGWQFLAKHWRLRIALNEWIRGHPGQNTSTWTLTDGFFHGILHGNHDIFSMPNDLAVLICVRLKGRRCSMLSIICIFHLLCLNFTYLIDFQRVIELRTSIRHIEIEIEENR